jgi:porphobilinogen synthase
MATITSTRLALTRRPRRLRRSDAIRALVRETRLSPDCLILPLFVVEGQGVRREIGSMPGVYQLSVDEVVKEADSARKEGVPGVLLFGSRRPRTPAARRRRTRSPGADCRARLEA